MKEVVKEILFDSKQIEDCCTRLAKEIDRDYAEKTPLLVGLLKGSVPFMADLIKRIETDITIDFMGVSSYVGTESSGEVTIVKDLEISVKGLDIIIVEDIIDTGRTIKAVRDCLLRRGANSVKVVTLLDKPERRVVTLIPDYNGFVIPNVFVIGYGIDFNQKYRNLPYVGVMKEEYYQ